MDGVANRLYSFKGQQLNALVADAERTYEAIRAEWLLACPITPENHKRHDRLQRIRRAAWGRVQRRRSAYLRYLYQESRP